MPATWSNFSANRSRISRARSAAHNAYTSSRNAKMTSPSCNCSFTGARASCTAKQNRIGMRGSPCSPPSHCRITPRVPSSSCQWYVWTVENRHPWTPEHVVTSTNAVNRKNGGAGVEISHRSYWMLHAICACPGRHCELIWCAHLLNSEMHCRDKHFATRRRNTVPIPRTPPSGFRTAVMVANVKNWVTSRDRSTHVWVSCVKFFFLKYSIAYRQYFSCNTSCSWVRFRILGRTHTWEIMIVEKMTKKQYRNINVNPSFLNSLLIIEK